MPFTPVDPRQSFPELEKEILAFWKQNKIFEKSIEQRPADKLFTFYDGPPFATGLPHYGHLIQSAIKDVVPRYWTMKGYRVTRRWGWDCHGLPIENIIEKELNLSSKKDIETMGVGTFNEACRSAVMRFANEWEMYINRLGRWVDFANGYKTMDPDYMESAWWVFAELWKKGLIYQGYKSMHICPRCATPLSISEVSLNYQDDTDPSVIVKFPIAGKEKTYFLAWTTTPWTLPGNVLLAVNAKERYLTVKLDEEHYILGKTRSEELLKDRKYSVLDEYLGADLLGMKYEPLYDVVLQEGLSYEVVAGDFVSIEDGTSIVHIAPAFGEDDLRIGIEQKAGFVQHVSMDGIITADFPLLAGQQVSNVNSKIIDDLQNRKLLFSRIDYLHSYPHCWRCDEKLLNYATTSWFVKVTAIKEQLLEQNATIHWVPEHLRDGRFGDWLVNARDWAISRNRYWGAPLPVWRCDNCSEITVMGSRQELEQASGKEVTDLHKHFVDDLTWVCSACGKGTMKRVPEVLDCWFESGSMPYASIHYPFDNKTFFEENFPSDFIGEAIDQTRGWFYTLHVLGVALFGRPAFKNVTCTGLVLAEDGQKMSKRKQNYPDPLHILDTYGADSLRFYLMNSPVVQGEDLRFSEKELLELQRNFLLMLWNSYSFFITYANLYNWTPTTDVVASDDPLDQWILSRLETLKERLNDDMDSFHLYKATQHYQPFLGDLSKWYIRRSRKRFTGADTQALAVLYAVLLDFVKLLAPFMPFVTEAIYKNLLVFNTVKSDMVSVHLTDYPTSNTSNKNDDLEEAMLLVRDIVEAGHRVRKEAALKVRQPLASITVTLLNQQKELFEKPYKKQLIEIIADELNVKSVLFSEKESGSIPDVVFDLVITPELRKEGVAREIIRHIQNMRKEQKMDLHAIISVLLSGDSILQEAVDEYRTMITDQIKATSIQFQNSLEGNLIAIDKELSVVITISAV